MFACGRKSLRLVGKAAEHIAYRRRGFQRAQRAKQLAGFGIVLAQIVKPLLDARDMIQAGIALFFHAAVFLQQCDDLRPAQRRRLVFDHPAQVGHAERAAANHQRLATGNRQARLPAPPIHHLAISDNGDA